MSTGRFSGTNNKPLDNPFQNNRPGRSGLRLRSRVLWPVSFAWGLAQVISQDKQMVSYMSSLNLCQHGLGELGGAHAAPFVTLWNAFLTKRNGPLRKIEWQITVLLLGEMVDEEYAPNDKGVKEFFEDREYLELDIHDDFKDYLNSGETEEHAWLWEPKHDPSSPEFDATAR